MSWCRLEATFWQSAKAKRLARRLGVSYATACGHLTLLWSWACTHAPDGDLRQFEADDLEDAVAWEGERGALVSALTEPDGAFGPWIDIIEADDDGPRRMELHGYLDRAESYRRAAEMKARRARERVSQSTPPTPAETPGTGVRDARVTHASVTRYPERRGEERTGSLSSVRDARVTHASVTHADDAPPEPASRVSGLTPGRDRHPESLQRPLAEPTVDDREAPGRAGGGARRSARQAAPSASEVMTAWNEVAERSGLPRALNMTDARTRALRSRVAEDPARQSIGWWQSYFEQVAAMPHLRGENDRGWRAGLDFALHPQKLLKIIEGSYESQKPTKVIQRPRRGIRDLDAPEQPDGGAR